MAPSILIIILTGLSHLGPGMSSSVFPETSSKDSDLKDDLIYWQDSISGCLKCEVTGGVCHWVDCLRGFISPHPFLSLLCPLQLCYLSSTMDWNFPPSSCSPRYLITVTSLIDYPTLFNFHMPNFTKSSLFNNCFAYILYYIQNQRADGIQQWQNICEAQSGFNSQNSNDNKSYMLSYPKKLTSFISQFTKGRLHKKPLIGLKPSLPLTRWLALSEYC